MISAGSKTEDKTGNGMFMSAAADRPGRKAGEKPRRSQIKTKFNLNLINNNMRESLQTSMYVCLWILNKNDLNMFSKDGFLKKERKNIQVKVKKTKILWYIFIIIVSDKQLISSEGKYLATYFISNF